MRAIITCTTHISNEKLKGLLVKLNFCPNRDISEDQKKQLKELIIFNQDEITKDIPDGIILNKDENKKDVVDNAKIIHEVSVLTTVCTLYDGETRTWGIVSRPNKDRLIFRLKNPISTRLKLACSALITALRSKKAQEILNGEECIDREKGSFNKIRLKVLSVFSKSTDSTREYITSETKEYFDFYNRIEVLEKGSSDYSFSGTIIDQDTFRAARNDRKTEWKIAGIAATLSAIFLILTSPLVTTRLNMNTPFSWSIWVVGMFERLSSAFVVTTGVSILDVVLHWETIRLEYPIRWEV